jgi:hypothetical protein
MLMRSLAAITMAFGLGGCLFTGAETEGLPCNGNGECAPGLRCIERVCCRDAASCMADGTGQGTATDAATEPETETEPPVASDDGSVRDRCDDSDTVCLDDDVLRYCSDDGKLTTKDCRGFCGEFLETLGCLHVVADDEDTCICTFEVESCSPEGATSCDAAAGAMVCDGGTWTRGDCDDVCVAAGYAGADYCDAGTCYCGDVCQEGASRCSGPSTNEVCYGGTWYADSCSTICGDAGYAQSLGCFYYPGDDSYCMCL